MPGLKPLTPTRPLTSKVLGDTSGTSGKPPSSPGMGKRNRGLNLAGRIKPRLSSSTMAKPMRADQKGIGQTAPGIGPSLSLSNQKGNQY